MTGEVRCGKLLIRSTEKSPSRWGPDGFLEKGLLYIEKFGYFNARTLRHGALYLVEGSSTKAPK